MRSKFRSSLEYWAWYRDQLHRLVEPHVEVVSQDYGQEMKVKHRRMMEWDPRHLMETLSQHQGEATEFLGRM